MRQIVEARDVQVYFGKSKHTSYKTLRKIRQDLGKSSSQPITIQEFDAYFKIEKNGIASAIIENDELKNASKSKKWLNKTHKNDALLLTETENKPYQFAKKSW